MNHMTTWMRHKVPMWLQQWKKKFTPEGTTYCDGVIATARDQRTISRVSHDKCRMWSASSGSSIRQRAERDLLSSHTRRHQAKLRTWGSSGRRSPGRAVRCRSTEVAVLLKDASTGLSSLNFGLLKGLGIVKTLEVRVEQGMAHTSALRWQRQVDLWDPGQPGLQSEY